MAKVLRPEWASRTVPDRLPTHVRAITYSIARPYDSTSMSTSLYSCKIGRVAQAARSAHAHLHVGPCAKVVGATCPRTQRYARVPFDVGLDVALAPLILGGASWQRAQPPRVRRDRRARDRVNTLENRVDYVLCCSHCPLLPSSFAASSVLALLLLRRHAHAALPFSLPVACARLRSLRPRRPCALLLQLRRIAADRRSPCARWRPILPFH